MNIAFFSYKSYDKQWFDQHVDSDNYKINYFRVKLDKSTATYARGADVICAFVNDDLSKEVINILSDMGVKMIALRCAGFNNVDLDAAAAKGIPVYRVPEYSPHAVAEHAVALILTLNRKTHKAYNRVRDGNFSLSRLTGFNLYGKTVGVLGTGKIGRVFADLMHGFGCRILLYDKFPDTSLEEKGYRYVDLSTLLKESDIVSLHVPLMPETAHIINRETLKLMKDNAMLINTSRGGLINTEHTLEALRNKKLGYLGIDVYEQEEGLFFHNFQEQIIDDNTLALLMSFPNVLVTAHQAFFTQEALDEITKTTLQNIQDFNEGRSNENIIDTP
ncbi:2-hydroxyacid dehydrogenase [Lentiprolixibacter aurantiacus]|uniref:2-hydroxyacid dehydrogenase n=1 Tax=Lentiprolixibacter aurantiacus TaxID=2993939 RepID=A0AAE3MM67_9FLAO|nr:2-hydroxyacid dehydrogenase [Lentiprolixibacter aurantiacus]MCX2720350.1 2-hydroxyacid dehydrogenase [Lentiprolixibacter aurantiacus]